MKIIHCADLHLDSNMTSNLSREQAKQRKAELLATFERMIAYAKDNSVKAVIIAGICMTRRIYQLMQEMFFCLQLITIQI